MVIIGPGPVVQDVIKAKDRQYIDQTNVHKTLHFVHKTTQITSSQLILLPDNLKVIFLSMFFTYCQSLEFVWFAFI